jgi:hypothetical protein
LPPNDPHRYSRHQRVLFAIGWWLVVTLLIVGVVFLALSFSGYWQRKI